MSLMESMFRKVVQFSCARETMGSTNNMHITHKYFISPPLRFLGDSTIAIRSPGTNTPISGEVRRIGQSQFSYRNVSKFFRYSGAGSAGCSWKIPPSEPTWSPLMDEQKTFHLCMRPVSRPVSANTTRVLPAGLYGIGRCMYGIGHCSGSNGGADTLRITPRRHGRGYPSVRAGRQSPRRAPSKGSR